MQCTTYLHVIVHFLPQSCNATIPVLNLSNFLLNLQSQDVYIDARHIWLQHSHSNVLVQYANTGKSTIASVVIHQSKDKWQVKGDRL